MAGCQQKEGCTDPTAANYDADAIEDDGSCAYAGCTNSDAWNFNAAATIDDGSCELPTLDGYSYKTVQIGDQVWFAENLRTSVYANGDPIPADLTGEEMELTEEGFTTVYGTDDDWYPCSHESPEFDACDEVQSLAVYGRLYNFYSVEDERGLCPVGWHVPDTAEWAALHRFVVSEGFAGQEALALKSTTGWADQSDGTTGNGTDDFGFAFLPGSAQQAGYWLAGQRGNVWSSTPEGGGWGWGHQLERTPFWESGGSCQCTRADAFSVRCVRDPE